MSAPTALITGPTAGIGREFARQLASRGHDLVLVARDEARLGEVADELATTYGVRAEVLRADLADPAQLALVEARLADRERPVDLLVNNAGFGLGGTFLEHPIEREQAQLDVLVTAVLRLSHAALGAMVERGPGAAGRGIINVSSVAGFLPGGPYSAAKAWVNSFSEWAAAAYAPEGVTVMALCPGFTKTEFHQRLGGRPGSGYLWLEAPYVVTKALADFEKGRVYSIPGAQYKTIASATRIIPKRVLRLASRGL